MNISDMNIFKESNGAFSWRKTGTALIYALFAYLIIGYGIKHGFDEIPGSYMVVFYIVITYYFARKPIEAIGSKKKSDVVQPPNPNDTTPR